MTKLLSLFAQLKTDTLPNIQANDHAVNNMLTTVFEIVGAIAFLVLVISGLRYVLSGGDPGKMAQAKKSILYALIGLVVVLSAYAIVTLVVKGVI